jgi:hypothetical protein
MAVYGEIDYPWGVSGYWTQTYFNDNEEYTTAFTGTFSEDGNTLVIDWTGEREGLYGYYDLEIEGTWTATR